LREKQRESGLRIAPSSTLPNRKSVYATVEAETQARNDALVEQARLLRPYVEGILGEFAKIPDPRNAKKLEHLLPVVMLYGLLSFVYQMTSRRDANEKMSQPVFMNNIQTLFPELRSVPHQDTLNRLLSRIDVNQIEQAHLSLVRRLMRQKKFVKLMREGCYPVSFDGSQKMVRTEPRDEEWQQRVVGEGETERSQYYVYVLEASLTFSNGMTIPLMTEFLSMEDGDTATQKQDCELKAFYRLANRLKRAFPKTPFMLLLDGLYANGPVMARCRKCNWQFMIVLQDKSLKSVWEDYEGLQKLEEQTHRFERDWGERHQTFHWSNNISYEYGDNGKQRQKAHVVVLEETWKEVDPVTLQSVEKHARHAWLSSEPIFKTNVHERCNLAARHRWGIETEFLVQKHQGYQFEHCFSYDWQAMKGYHFLMRLALLLNVLCQFAQALAAFVRTYGKQGLIDFLRETLSAPWLRFDYVRRRLAVPGQLRLT